MRYALIPIATLVVMMTFAAFAYAGCANPAGGTYCGKKSDSSCFCDAKCEKLGNCCSDYKSVCGASLITGKAVSSTSTPLSVGSDSSIAIGNSATAKLKDDIAVGTGALTANTGAGADMGGRVAIGKNSQSNGFGSVAIGSGSTSLGAGIALGQGAFSGSIDGPIAIGGFSTANNSVSIAIGRSSNSLSGAAIGIGYVALAASMSGVAIGDGAQAGNPDPFNTPHDPFDMAFRGAIAIGGTARALNGGSMALGFGSRTTAEDGISIGTRSESSGFRGIAIGPHSTSLGSGIALGPESFSGLTDSPIAIGHSAFANGSVSIAIGKGAHASGGAAIRIGYSGAAFGLQTVAIGDGAMAGDFERPLNDNRGATALGGVARAIAPASTAIGVRTRVEQLNGIAIGPDALVSHENSIALGAGAQTTERDQLVIGANETKTLIDWTNNGKKIGVTNPINVKIYGKLGVSGLPNKPVGKGGIASGRGVVCIDDLGNLFIDDDGTVDCLKTASTGTTPSPNTTQTSLLKVSKTSAKVGETITVSWDMSGKKQTASDWIALVGRAEKYAGGSAFPYHNWLWLSGTRTAPGKIIQSGTMNFKVPSLPRTLSSIEFVYYSNGVEQARSTLVLVTP